MGFTGTVVSGTGATYQVMLNTGATAQVTILGIDPNETVPPGTPLIVVQIGGGYFSTVPMWVQ